MFFWESELVNKDRLALLQNRTVTILYGILGLLVVSIQAITDVVISDTSVISTWYPGSVSAIKLLHGTYTNDVPSKTMGCYISTCPEIQLDQCLHNKFRIFGPKKPLVLFVPIFTFSLLFFFRFCFKRRSL